MDDDSGLKSVPRQRLDSEGSSPPSQSSSSGWLGAVSEDSRLYKIFGGAKGAYWCVSVDFFGLGTILPLLPFYISEVLCTEDIGVEEGCTWSEAQSTCFANLTVGQASCIDIFDDGTSIGCECPGLKGNNEKWMGFVLTGQYAGVVVGAALMGYLADRWGRKVGVLTAMMGDAVFFAASALAALHSIQAFFVLRLTAGVFTPIAPATAWLVDSVKSEDRGPALAKLAASMMGGYLLGAGGGTLVAVMDGGIPAACWVSAIFALFIFFAITQIPEPVRTVESEEATKEASVEAGVGNAQIGPMEAVRRSSISITRMALESPRIPITSSEAIDSKKSAASDSDDPANNWKRVAKSPQWITVAFILFNNGLLFGALLTLSGQSLANDFKWSETQVSVTYLTMVVLLIVVAIFAYRPLVEKVGRRKFLTGALTFGVVLTIFMAIFSKKNAWAFTFLVVSLFVATSTIVPTGTHIASELADRWCPNAQGTILGLTRAMFTVGQAVGPAVSGALAAVSDSLPWIIACVCMSIGLLSHLVCGDSSKSDQKPLTRKGSWDVSTEAGGAAPTSTEIVEM